MAEELTTTASQLWHPGQPLEVPFHTPSPEEFRLHFAHTVWQGDDEPGIVTLDGSLSALRWPEQQPTAVAFLDMDELIGNLGGSLRELQHPNGHTETFTHDYGYEMFFTNGDNYIKWPLIRLVKNHQAPGIGMRPVQEIEAIRSMVKSWRAAGVYVVFITSAIEGAELLHVDFAARYFAGACDGMVITSGDYRLVDKGRAAAEVVDILDLLPGTPAVHLDDLPHNTRNVRRALEAHPRGLRVATFQHVFPHTTHEGHDEGSIPGATPLDTFIGANDFLEATLGRRVHIPLRAILRGDLASIS